MNFKFENINDPIFLKVSENLLNEKYSLVTPNFGNKQPCVLTSRYSKFADKIRSFEIYSDDIWVLSYPKTGTTWTQEMVWLICNNLDYKGAEILLDTRFPFIEVGGIKDLPPERDPYGQAVSMASPRFIKSHLPLLFLPTEIWNKNPKIVYVARKVKDVCVSYYYHQKMMANYTGTLEEYAESFLADLALFSPFHEHVLDFHNLRNQKNVLFLKFEDLKTDLEAEVRKTIAFFDKSYSDDDIKKLCNHLSFNTMKENSSVNKQNMSKDGNKFIRKGKVNGWKDDLSEELSQKFDNWTKSKVKDPETLKLFL